MIRECDECERTGDQYKLWRMYSSWSNIPLLCGEHVLEDYRKEHPEHKEFELEPDGSHESAWEFSRPGEMTWEMGWYVPAIELEDGTGWWGYTSDNPDCIIAWEKWKQLLND